jgi:6-phosphogluconolactonase (cycloisomerase 2 family)
MLLAPVYAPSGTVQGATMIRIRIAALVTLIALPLGGCGGGADGSGNSSGIGPQPSAPSRYLYVSSFSDPSAGAISGQIYGYKFAPATNGLTEVAGSPFPGSASGAPVVISRDSKFVYTSNYSFSNNQFSDSYLLAFSVQPDGTLAVVPGSPIATSEAIAAVVTNPAQDYLYAVSVASNLTVYSIDPATGVLTEQPTNPVVSVSSVVLISPDGQHLYSVSASEIDEFSIDPSSGAISALPVSTVAVPSTNAFGLAGVAMDPSGKFLYMTNSAQFTGFGGPGYAWSIDPQSGALSLVSGFQPTPGSQGSIAVDDTGKYAIVNTFATSKTGPNCFSVLSIDPTSGVLASVPGSPFPQLRGDCGFFLADFSAPYLYSVGQAAVSVFSLDETTGAPGLVTSAPTLFYAATNAVVTH